MRAMVRACGVCLGRLWCDRVSWIGESLRFRAHRVRTERYACASRCYRSIVRLVVYRCVVIAGARASRGECPCGVGDGGPCNTYLLSVKK